MNAPANGKAARRLETFKRLLAHLHGLASLDFGFVLWDGSTVPADLPPDALAIAFADEGVVAALLRRPNADTFLNLWVTARVDIRNGDIFDFLQIERPSKLDMAGAPALFQRMLVDIAKTEWGRDVAPCDHRADEQGQLAPAVLVVRLSG